ncbi:MAG: hypothetical protein ACJ8CR_25000 [Roseiflexaceae bacterium]
MRDNRQTLPAWLGGILLGLLLILISTQGGGINSEALVRRFAPDPNAPPPAPFQLPQVSLPSLPEGMQRTLTGLRDRLAGGQTVPALTPVASGPRVRIEVREIKRSGEQVKVSGTVGNISNAPLEIGLSAFSFRDSAGVTYAASGASTTLRPGQSTALDLALPLPEGRGLTLVVTLPPDPPIEQVLVVETKP